MINVIVADDEPMALEMIKTIIEKRCEGFQVIDIARDGREALEKIREQRPDVVISDIRMPEISGIQLGEIIQDQMPETYFIIISGYQNFEYAQRGIRANAIDYILKPVMPADLEAALRRVEKRIRNDQYNERNYMLRQLCNGKSFEPDKIEKYFPSKMTYAGFLRRNGLPRRFSRSVGREIYANIDERYMIYGRDEQESLYLIPEELLNERETIDGFMIKTMERQKTADSYMTVLFLKNPFSLDQLPEKVQLIYKRLEQVSTIGRTQVLEADNAQLTEKQSDFDDNGSHVFINMVENLLRLHKMEQVRELVAGLLAKDEKEKKPQYVVEYHLSGITNLITQYNLQNEQNSFLDREYLLDEAFCNASSMASLKESYFDIVFGQNDPYKENTKVDSPEFFQDIRRYMENHMAEALSLSGICREFGVSQTYLSRLFRKYAELSFNQELTKMRMEKAKELINANPEFYIKDIAALVGYSDQFYFSRVFRSYEGISPSEYILKNEENE